MVQLLRLCASTTEGKSSIPGQGTQILHAALWGKKKKKIKKEFKKNTGKVYNQGARGHQKTEL